MWCYADDDDDSTTCCTVDSSVPLWKMMRHCAQHYIVYEDQYETGVHSGKHLFVAFSFYREKRQSEIMINNYKISKEMLPFQNSQLVIKYTFLM